MRTNFLVLPIIILLISCKSDQKSPSPEEISPVTENKESLLMFAGTYTIFGDPTGSEGIYSLSFDPTTGEIRKGNLVGKTTNPSYITVDADNHRIYAVNETVGESPLDGGAISAFTYSDESIDQLNTLPVHGGAPCYILQHDGHLYVSNYVGGNHEVFPILPDGKIGEKAMELDKSNVEVQKSDQAQHAHMIERNPHNGNIYTVDLGTSRMKVYDINTSTSKIKVKHIVQLGDNGPRHLAFHPTDPDIVYVLNEIAGNINAVKTSEGSYEILQEIASTKNGPLEGALCADIHIHPNGQFLYASNRGEINTISVYTIEEDGRLAYQSEHSTKGKFPRNFVIDPSGKFLIVANQHSDNIVTFSIDEETGALRDTGHELELPMPVCLKFEHGA